MTGATGYTWTRAQTVRAREMRRATTKQEAKLWFYLRDAQLGGFSFRRQHPVDPYYLDFYCAKVRLAVELDGSQHGDAAAVEYDAARTRFLTRKGIRVLRFWNHDLDGDGLQGVLDAMLHALQTAPTRAPAVRVLPVSRGGLP
jgi:very-short-patch-repair endonuclease